MSLIESLFDSTVALPTGFPLRVQTPTRLSDKKAGYYSYFPAAPTTAQESFSDHCDRIFTRIRPRLQIVTGLARYAGSKTDVGPLLQDAIDEAGTKASAAEPIAIQIPEGRFYLDMKGRKDGLYLRHSNVWLSGTGIDKTIFEIPAGGVGQRVLFCGDPSYDDTQNRAVPQNIRVQDLTLDLNNTGAFVAGIAVRKPVDGLIVERVRGIQSALAAGEPSNHSGDSWLCSFECYAKDINRNIFLVDVESDDQMQLHAGGGGGIINFYNLRPWCRSGRANGMTITNVGTEGQFENINFIEPYIDQQTSRAIWIGPDDDPRRLHNLSKVTRPCTMRGLKIIRPMIGATNGSNRFGVGILIQPFLGGISDVSIEGAVIDDPRNADIGLVVKPFDYHWISLLHKGVSPMLSADDVDLRENAIRIRNHELCSDVTVVLHPNSASDRLPSPLVAGRPYVVRVRDPDSLELSHVPDGAMPRALPVVLKDQGSGAFLLTLRPYVTGLTCGGLRQNTTNGTRLMVLRNSRFEDCGFGRLDISMADDVAISRSRAGLVNIGDDTLVFFQTTTFRTPATETSRPAIVQLRTTQPTETIVEFSECTFVVDPATTTHQPFPVHAVASSQEQAITIDLRCCRSLGQSGTPWDIAPGVSANLSACPPAADISAP